MGTQRHTHFGAYGLVLRQDDILLVLKSRGPYIDCWDLPGGRIEFGESPGAALARELKEETGFQMKGGPLLIATGSHTVVWSPREDLLEELHHLGFIYRVTLADEQQSPVVFRNNEDTASVEWKSRTDPAVLPLTPFAAQILRTIILTTHQ